MPRIQVKDRIPGAIYWVGESPSRCDCCDKPIRDLFVDGKTKGGPWGNLLPECHATIGLGLGMGLGQKYQRQEDGRWLKIEG
jgi:hypothetical protein